MSDAYKVQYSPKAAKQLQHLDKTIARRIMDKVRDMANTAQTYPHKALKGEWSNYYKLRVSKFRVIYRLDHEDQIVFVEQVGLRDDIYDV